MEEIRKLEKMGEYLVNGKLNFERMRKYAAILDSVRILGQVIEALILAKVIETI